MDPARSIEPRRHSENFFSDLQQSASSRRLEKLKKITLFALSLFAIMAVSATAGYGVAYLLHYRFKQRVMCAAVASAAGLIMSVAYKYFKKSRIQEPEEEETVVVKKSWLSRFTSKHVEKNPPEKA